MKYIRSFRDIIVLIVILYLSEAIGIMIGSLIYVFFPEISLTNFLYVIVSTAVYLLILYMAVTGYTNKILHIKRQDYGLVYQRKSVYKWIFYAVCLSLIVLLMTMLFYRGTWYVAPQKEWLFRLFRAIVDFGIGAGIAEEIIFRGALLKVVDGRLGKLPAIGVTSVIFAILHVTNIDSIMAFLLTFLYTMILAVLLCIIKYKTGNLWAAIAVHSTWNFIFLGCVAPGSTASQLAVSSYITDSEWYLFIPIIVCAFSCLLLVRKWLISIR